MFLVNLDKREDTHDEYSKPKRLSIIDARDDRGDRDDREDRDCDVTTRVAMRDWN